VATREPIQVPCDVEADPPQVTFRWALNNSIEMQPIKNHVSAQLRSIAHYAPRTKFGYGELYCWGSNAVGEQKEPCIFQVVAAGQPQPVQNCLVGNQSTDSLVIKCEPGEDGGLEQSFHLEIYHSGRGQLEANLSSQRWPVFDVQVGVIFFCVCSLMLAVKELKFMYFIKLRDEQIVSYAFFIIAFYQMFINHSTFYLSDF